MAIVTDAMYQALKASLFQQISSEFLVFQANDTLLQSDGKRYTFVNYFNRTLRTTTSQLLLADVKEDLNNYEHNLVYVNYYSDCSELCLRWQDRVYWTDHKYKSYKPLDDALGGGLLHPNCRHTIDLYYEDLEDELKADYPESFDDIRENAAKEAQKRYNERGIRKWKERNAKAKAFGSKKDIAHTSKKLKEWQAKPHNSFRVDDYYNVF